MTCENDNRHLLGSFTCVAAILLLLAGLYSGSYFLMASPSQYIVHFEKGSEVPDASTDINMSGNVKVLPKYSFGGERATLFYSPLHALDQKLRPKTWIHYVSAGSTICP